MASIYDQIEGYWSAIAAESIGRDAAYLNLPKLVAGVVVRPLTLRDYLRLSANRSPFVCGGVADWNDACLLLWLQRARPSWLPSWVETRRGFSRRIGKLPLDSLAAACGEYISQALVDAPTGGTKKGGYYSFGASLIHVFRREYPGTTRDEILDAPLDQLLQERRCIQESRNPQTVLFNRSDRLKGQYLHQLNTKMAEQSAGEETP